VEGTQQGGSQPISVMWGLSRRQITPAGVMVVYVQSSVKTIHEKKKNEKYDESDGIVWHKVV
jgi:hypothetical protein